MHFPYPKPMKKYAKKHTKRDTIAMFDKVKRQTIARHNCTVGDNCAKCGMIMSGYCPLKDIK